jgi:hypothetical protein
LYSWCKNESAGFQDGACSGFITGSYDLAESGGLICGQKGVTVRQIRDVVFHFSKQNQKYGINPLPSSSYKYCDKLSHAKIKTETLPDGVSFQKSGPPMAEIGAQRWKSSEPRASAPPKCLSS